MRLLSLVSIVSVHWKGQNQADEKPKDFYAQNGSENAENNGEAVQDILFDQDVAAFFVDHSEIEVVAYFYVLSGGEASGFGNVFAATAGRYVEFGQLGGDAHVDLLVAHPVGRVISATTIHLRLNGIKHFPDILVGIVYFLNGTFYVGVSKFIQILTIDIDPHTRSYFHDYNDQQQGEWHNKSPANFLRDTVNA